MTDRIRVGFIGAGEHSGRKLYPSLEHAGLELVAVCARRPETARARAAEYGVARYYTDYREMCDRESLDAVLLCVGPQGHFELGKVLVERGYHVWMEKPCAPSAAQADELAAAAASVGRIVQVGFNYRYTLGVQKVRSLVESGRFAAPALVAVRWWLGQPDPEYFRLHYMVHAVDLLHYLAGGDLGGLYVEHQIQAGHAYYVATLRGSDGCIAVLELSTNMSVAGHWSRVDLLSQDGMLSVSDFTSVTHYTTVPDGRRAGPDAPAYDGDRIWRTESLYAKGSLVEVWGYVTELDRFRRAVLGKQAPEATVAEAAWGLHICEELVKSPRQGA